MIGDNDFLLLAGIVGDDIYCLFFSDLFLAYVASVIQQIL